MPIDYEKVTRDLTDKAQLIETGWQALRRAAYPVDTPAAQLDDMRAMFYCGAAHLLASIMTILEPGEEPTEKDLKRLILINKELDEFMNDFQLRRCSTVGRAQ